MRNFKKIFGYIFVITAILFGIGFVFRYKYLVNQESEKFIDEQFINKKIRGHLSAIVRYKQDEVVLGIDNHEKYEIRYGTLCIDSTFLKNIQEKDSVFKDVGEEYLNFINKEGKQSRLKVIFCDL